MSNNEEQKNRRELSDEELEQVTGGNRREGRKISDVVGPLLDPSSAVSRTKQDKLKKAGGQVDEDEELVLSGIDLTAYLKTDATRLL